MVERGTGLQSQQYLNIAPKATPKTPNLPQLSTPDRDSSPELGSPSKITQYNKSTGRPIRKSAGTVKKAAGYVDSAVLEEEDDDFDPLTSDATTDNEDEDMTPRGRLNKSNQKQKQKQKRKRSPSLPSPRLEPMIYNQELDELTDNETGDAGHSKTPRKSPITLQFNVPLGFHGPLFVKLDSALLNSNEEGVRHEMHQPQKKARTSGLRASSEEAQIMTRTKGFTDLPPELRNVVYRHAFVRNGSLKIPQRCAGTGLGQSGQFLRTCKLVHDEACSILYGENSFAFMRHHDTRAPFWDPKPKEIGYQDFLHFLKMIGSENIQYLRNLSIEFDDALPKHSEGLTIETRRYVVDDYLMNCLRVLREAKLRKISLVFLGRRQLFRSDVKFLGYLEQIKADEVVKISQPWPFAVKISAWVWDGIKEQMTRKKKLYEKK